MFLIRKRAIRGVKRHKKTNIGIENRALLRRGKKGIRLHKGWNGK